MSLKSFHVVFIFACLSLMGFSSWWSLARAQWGLLFCSAAGLASGMGYLGWFLRAHRALR